MPNLLAHHALRGCVARLIGALACAFHRVQAKMWLDGLKRSESCIFDISRLPRYM